MAGKVKPQPWVGVWKSQHWRWVQGSKDLKDLKDTNKENKNDLQKRRPIDQSLVMSHQETRSMTQDLGKYNVNDPENQNETENLHNKEIG